MKASKLKCEDVKIQWVITLECSPWNSDKYIASFPLYKTLLDYNHLKWGWFLFSLEKVRDQQDLAAACFIATRSSTRRNQARSAVHWGKRQQGVHWDKMFALDLRKKLPWEAIPQSRAGYAEVVQSVLKRFSRPDWMQPWLNPALSRMLDVRPSQQEGCFKQHLPVRCH